MYRQTIPTRIVYIKRNKLTAGGDDRLHYHPPPPSHANKTLQYSRKSPPGTLHMGALLLRRLVFIIRSLYYPTLK